MDIDEDDLALDVIRRTCILMDLESEPRMYLKLENGVEVGGMDTMGDYVARYVLALSSNYLYFI